MDSGGGRKKWGRGEKKDRGLLPRVERTEDEARERGGGVWANGEYNANRRKQSKERRPSKEEKKVCAHSHSDTNAYTHPEGGSMKYESQQTAGREGP